MSEQNLNKKAKVVAVCSSPKKGMRKVNIGKGFLKRNHGLEGDSHTGTWHRQVSFLGIESVNKMRDKGLDVNPGDFAENITTEGIEWYKLPVGTRLKVGDDSLAEITQIGKECHDHCAIYEMAGDCVMPREGIFIRVLKDGELKVDDIIELKDFITYGVLVASDTGAKGEREDQSGTAIIKTMNDISGINLDYEIVADDKKTIKSTLKNWVKENHLDIIFTTGGTGFGPRDNTPEATLDVIDKEAPGLAEAMRYESLKHTSRAILSRAVAGIRDQTLIINLPGSPKAVQENLAAIIDVLPHGIDILRGVTSNCARN